MITRRLPSFRARGLPVTLGAVLILNVRVPGEPARRIRLDRPVLTLGRSSTNDVPLADRTLSRVHARLEVTDLAVRLVDLG
jgi:pSer/pThr/pTyr-binding forkhead associated (FHA) protein